MTPDNVAETAALLSSVPEAVRMLKIVEEAGEVAEAYIGWTGANPRKGVTHTHDDVASELLDVALTALVAWCGHTGLPCPLLALDEHAQSRNQRHRLALGVPDPQPETTREPLRRVTTRREGGITRSQLDALYRADPHIDDDDEPGVSA